MTSSTVREMELLEVLRRLRDVRAWALRRRLDPWAFRQALIIVMEIDTAAAIEHGRTTEQLAEFDVEARRDAQEWVRNCLNA